MSNYVKINFKNNVTKLNDTNMNHIEEGIVLAHSNITAVQSELSNYIISSMYELPLKLTLNDYMLNVNLPLHSMLNTVKDDEIVAELNVFLKAISASNTSDALESLYKLSQLLYVDTNSPTIFEHGCLHPTAQTVNVNSMILGLAWYSSSTLLLLTTSSYTANYIKDVKLNVPDKYLDSYIALLTSR